MDFWWINLGMKSKINDELLMNISDFVSIITSRVGLACLSPKMSKEFAGSTKVLSRSEASNMSVIEFVWTVV